MLTETNKKFASVPHWCEIADMNRSATYNAIGRGELHAVKLGRRTLIDVEAGLRWLRSLPTAASQAPKEAVNQ
jgi:hypothetical protein